MNAERHRRISDLFLEACQAAPSDRAALLERAGADDPSLAREVESLLEHDSTASAALPLPAVPDPEFIFTPESRPDRIAEYRIVGDLGQGGMGVVYLAEQDKPRREVALKLVRARVLSKAALRRFEFEANVLGRLQHPGIAQIFGAGTAETRFGPQPYFAMERIRGKSLGEFAAAIDRRARLELVARIADAVQHAHRKGVIHRDLKPGNILVDDSGQPKILDFGIARLTDADVQATTAFAEKGQILGTLPYMSPEQLEGDPEALDTRSDVYALGVILYEVLAGRLPHRLGEKKTPEAIRTLCVEPPTPLSKIDRLLRGDVATIVEKAMERDRERRYQSASEFAADIRRYLSSQPIAARAPSSFYVLRTFVKRRKAAVAAGGALLLALALGLGFYLKAANSLDVATAASTAAGNLNEYYRKVLVETAATAPQKERPALIRLLGIGRAQLAPSKLSSLEAEAAVYFTLAEAYAALEHPAESEPLMRRAVELTELTHPGEPDALGATIALGDLLDLLHRPDDALRTWKDAATHYEEALGLAHPQVLIARHRLAGVLERQGDRNAAAREYELLLDRLSRASEPDDDLRLTVMNSLAVVYADLGRLSESAAISRSTMEEWTRRQGPESAGVYRALSNLSRTQLLQQDFAGAESTYRRILEQEKRLLAEEPSMVLHARDGLAFVLQRSNKTEEAERLLRETLALRRLDPRTDEEGIARTMRFLANLLAATGREKEAEPVFAEASAIAAEHFGSSLFRYQLDSDHGALLSAAERYDEAEILLSGAYEKFCATAGASSSDAILAARRLATLYARWGKPDRAREFEQRSRVPQSR